MKISKGLNQRGVDFSLCVNVTGTRPQQVLLDSTASLATEYENLQGGLVGSETIPYAEDDGFGCHNRPRVCPC